MAFSFDYFFPPVKYEGKNIPLMGRDCILQSYGVVKSPYPVRNSMVRGCQQSEERILGAMCAPDSEDCWLPQESSLPAAASNKCESFGL